LVFAIKNGELGCKLIQSSVIFAPKLVMVNYF
jgi:hypothetical protein